MDIIKIINCAEKSIATTNFEDIAMNRTYFKNLENLPSGSSRELDDVIDHLAFDSNGLIPVITQDHASKEILMFAWMNKESLLKTIHLKRMVYWSRSRNQLWAKGETSGHTQALVSMSFDCDGDVILCQVNQVGAACHTGRPNCFYLHVDLDENKITISGDSA